MLAPTAIARLALWIPSSIAIAVAWRSSRRAALATLKLIVIAARLRAIVAAATSARLSNTTSFSVTIAPITIPTKTARETRRTRS